MSISQIVFTGTLTFYSPQSWHEIFLVMCHLGIHTNYSVTHLNLVKKKPHTLQLHMRFPVM